MPDAAFRDEMLAALPNLRAFARALVHDLDWADDLVQETILRAWSKAHLFEPGTTLRAWLFVILRNRFYSEMRQQRRELHALNESHPESLRTGPDQDASLEWEDLQTALRKLRPEQREALILVGAEGLSYENAAAVCGVPIGTIKSRVSRARTRLAGLLCIDDWAEIGPDNLTKAALQAEARP